MFRSHATLFTGIGALSIALSVAAASAAPSSVEDNYPAPVERWLQQAKQDCPTGFQADHPIESVGLTGDGSPGFIADPHRLTCAGEPHLFVGDGPASIELYVTLPSGQLAHAAGVVALGYQVQPDPRGGPPTLVFQTHEASERTGSVDSYRWDGRNFAILNKRSLAMPPVDGF